MFTFNFLNLTINRIKSNPNMIITVEIYLFLEINIEKNIFARKFSRYNYRETMSMIYVRICFVLFDIFSISLVFDRTLIVPADRNKNA